MAACLLGGQPPRPARRPASGQGIDGGRRPAPRPSTSVRRRSPSSRGRTTPARSGRAAVRCWGWNDYGQLGDSTHPSGDVAPGSIVTVSLPAGGARHRDRCGRVPQLRGPHDRRPPVGAERRRTDRRPPGIRQPAVPPGRTSSAGKAGDALVVGASHTCARLDDFSVKCWGLNLDGELGIGDTANRGDDESLGDALPRVPLGPDPVSRLAPARITPASCKARRSSVGAPATRGASVPGTATSGATAPPNPITPAVIDGAEMR